MRIRPVGAELFHTDRRTDGRTDGQTNTTKLTVTFRKLANAPKEEPRTWTPYLALRLSACRLVSAIKPFVDLH
jgi:hypothetical protein